MSCKPDLLFEAGVYCWVAAAIMMWAGYGALVVGALRQPDRMRALRAILACKDYRQLDTNVARLIYGGASLGALGALLALCSGVFWGR